MRLKFDIGRLDSNYHDWRNGNHGETIRGPKFSIVRLETFINGSVRTLCGRRLWFYFPSGACWNFDVYFYRAEPEPRPLAGKEKL